MNRTKQEHNAHSEDELNEEINDKLSELWTGMRNKKKQLMRNLTPGYSRRSQRTLSELNATNTQTNLTNHHSVTDNHQLMKIKQKLASQESGRKLKETQIQRLKNTIAQLTNDKKILIKQIQNVTNHSISVSHLQQVDGRTANFYGKDKKIKGEQVFENRRQKKDSASCHNNKQNSSHVQNSSSLAHNNSSKKTKTKPDYSSSMLKTTDYNTLQDLPKSRLIELLKSTSQYRQFAYYYDSHELSYLKRLQQQHKKNCHTNYSQIQKKYWAPAELHDYMREQNAKQKWGLTELQLEEVISEAKQWFQVSEEIKLKQVKEYYMRKIDKLKRQKGNKLPYDLVRLANAREREICKKTKVRGKSMTNTQGVR